MRLAFPFFLVVSSPALAQKADPRPDPVRITVSGRIEMDGVVRDGAINETSMWTPGGLASSSDLRATDGFIAPLLTLRLDVELAPQIAAVVEAGNLRLNFDSFDPRLQTQRFGDDDLRVFARQAFVRVRAWPVEALDWTIGMQEFRRDPAGWGHPLFLTSAAESPWGELPDSVVPPFPAAGTNTVPQTRRDELQPAGLSAAFVRDRFRASIWLFPAMVEGGAWTDDEALYGLDASMDFPVGSGTITAGASLAFMLGGADLPDGGSQEEAAWTLGGWARAEIGVFDGFVEAYRQFGSAGRIGDETLRAGGYAFRIGARVRFEASWKPWLSAEFLWVSGDEDGLDSKEGRFLSYEDNDATPIVEANEFGLDVDNNYRALRGAAGLSFRPIAKLPPWEARTMLSWFTTVEKIPLGPDPPFGVSGTSDRLGVEWDLGLRIPWSKSLAFDLGASFLFGSDVMREFTKEGDRSAYLATFGARLQF